DRRAIQGKSNMAAASEPRAGSAARLRRGLWRRREQPGRRGGVSHGRDAGHSREVAGRVGGGPERRRGPREPEPGGRERAGSHDRVRRLSV
ncbi:MAG: hypothetical protein AVDCRST_MAG37-2400, partial [uncultured Rubrobacteraceae bacterium]